MLIEVLSDSLDTRRPRTGSSLLLEDRMELIFKTGSQTLTFSGLISLVLAGLWLTEASSMLIMRLRETLGLK